MKTKLLILSLGLLPSLLSAQTFIWGVGSGTGVADAEFSLPFTNATSAAFGVSNWTAQTISHSSGGATPGAAYWGRTTTGLTQGAYATGLPPIGSPSQANGAALFDSDFLDNGGVQGAFGTGSAPSIQIGDLVSPRIDLTGYTDTSLSVNFYCQWRNFQINNFLVSLSTNDGVSWTDVDINTLLPAGANVLNEGWVNAQFPSVTQGVLNLTACRIRFRFDGDYYFTLIDDVSIQSYCNSTSSSITEIACESYTSPSGNYVWNSSNTYADTIQNAAGCDSVITIDLTITNSTTGIDTRTECKAYTWIDGINYTASNNTATFNIAGGAANGCDSLVTLDLTINNVSDVTTTTVGTTISSNNSAATYQWLDCDNNYSVIPNALGQSYTPAADGNYAAQLTENGCVDTTACVAISTIGMIENEFGNNLNVYPNPTDGKFSIDLGESYETISITITDLKGKVIQFEEFKESQLLNLNSEQPAGIYLMLIESAEKKAVVRLIKE